MHQCHGIARSCFCKLDGMILWFHKLIWWFNFLLHLSTWSNIIDVMIHEYNTWTKKQSLVSNVALAKLEETISSIINFLKEEIINLKDIKSNQKATGRKQKVTKKIK